MPGHPEFALRDRWLSLAMPILIVEPLGKEADRMRDILEGMWFSDIDRAPDGLAALAMLNEKKYGLVIAALEMEPIDGLQLLRRVRSDDFMDTCFVLVGGSTRIEPVVAARQAQVDGYLLKPFTRRALRSKVRQVLSRAHKPSARAAG
ncbi:MAG TPA: response regulator [Beijerinckiaceae bacterium]|jgi:two-component system chemotaxis response regulator CheY